MARGVFERLKARGEEVLSQISNELMSSPHFVKALQAAMQGKEKLEGAVAQAMKNLNIPTRTEFKRALHRIEVLEKEVAELKAAKAHPRGKKSQPARKRPDGQGG